jgi:hypothetical protein
MESTQQSTLRSRWEGFDRDTRIRAVALLVVHALLVVLAYRSLSRRDPTSLRGPKWLWSTVIPASVSAIKPDTAWIAPVGPIAYFLLARRRQDPGA